jgi:sulfatase modifying factor 1
VSARAHATRGKTAAVRVTARSLLLLGTCAFGCGRPEPPAATPTEVKAPPPVETRPEPKPVEPAPQPEPEPVKPAPTLPDGRPIVACIDPPPPGLACVPGGSFVRGSDVGPEHSRPKALIWLQTVYMDVYEVTYAEYKACEKSGKCPKAGPRYSDFNRPRQPITGISWYDAVAYCKAVGKHLPTEAEWEKAARGPDGAMFPWGDDPVTCERAIIKDSRGRSCGVPKKGQPEKGRTFEVGMRPPGVYGLYDMSGNSWEWVADWATASYAACGAACEGVDPRGPCGGAEPCEGHKQKIVRGGSWYWDASYATAIYRRFHFPKNQPYHHFGFRCAASPEEAAALAGAQPAPQDSPAN